MEEFPAKFERALPGTPHERVDWRRGCEAIFKVQQMPGSSTNYWSSGGRQTTSLLGSWPVMRITATTTPWRYLTARGSGRARSQGTATSLNTRPTSVSITETTPPSAGLPALRIHNVCGEIARRSKLTARPKVLQPGDTLVTTTRLGRRGDGDGSDLNDVRVIR